MKLLVSNLVILLLAFFFIGSISMADEGMTAKVEVDKHGLVSIEAVDVPFAVVLNKLQEKSKFRIETNPESIDFDISASFASIPFEQALHRLLANISHVIVSSGNSTYKVSFFQSDLKPTVHLAQTDISHRAIKAVINPSPSPSSKEMNNNTETNLEDHIEVFPGMFLANSDNARKDNDSIDDDLSYQTGQSSKQK
jgi:hypothetical protein